MESAKAKGEDAQRCYNAAYTTISKAGYKAHKKAQKCQKKTKNDIKNNFDYIDDLVSVGFLSIVITTFSFVIWRDDIKYVTDRHFDWLHFLRLFFFF